MDSLIITDQDNEYYLNDQKIYFLENTKRINLFVGANNTRKSRFLRKIIAAESRIIVSSERPPNKLFIDSLSLVKEIEAQFKGSLTDNLIVVTTTRHPPTPGKRFYDVDAYFNTAKAANDKGVSLQTFVDHLNNINETMRGIRGGDNIPSLLKEIKMVYSVADMLVYLYGLRENMPALSNYQSHSNTWPEVNLNAYAFNFADGLVDDGPKSEKVAILNKIKDYLEFLLTINVSLGSNHLVYIPVLRSARTILLPSGSMIYEDVFKHTIHQQYFNGTLPNKGDQIYSAQLFYEAVKKQKGGSSYYRDAFGEFERFIGRSFFQSEKLEITAIHDEQSPKREITVDLPGERKDVPIQDLGDGIQAVINLLFPVFTANNDSWIFIDEPELNLHPGFQNLFIRTILENEFLKTKNLRYFINSHSNHILSELLLSGSEHAEIFVFSKKNKDASTISPFKGYEAATLELLGVLNTSTLISNCSVWVEGVTDRLYLRAYLTAYLKSGQPFNPIEGLNYTFIEYGGNNLVHYLFEDNTDPAAIDAGIKAYFINNKIFLLSDKDFDKDEKHQFYKKLAAKNFQYMHTQHIEIENLLPPEILAAFLTDKLNVPAAIAKDITKYSYKSTRLGKFLTGQFTKHQINRKVAAASGTLTTGYKSMLAEYVLNGIQSGKITWADFKSNIVIDEITTNLYNFIEKHNK